MNNSRFVYVTYIHTTAEKLWKALLEPEFTRQYWFGSTQKSEWKKGASWTLIGESGTITDTGEVLEIDPPRKLVLKWRNEFMPELKAEGFTQATFTLEPAGETMMLTVVHEMDVANAKTIGAVSNGWPAVLSNLKSLLETGKVYATKRPCAGKDAVQK